MPRPDDRSIDLIVGPGFLGAHLAEILSAAGRQVVCLARNPVQHPFRILACDISDRQQVAAAASILPQPIRLLVHCASSKGGGPDEYQKVYLEGARNCRDLLRPQRIIFVGSTSVYGQTSGEWVDESSTTQPGTRTGELLLAAEKEVLAGGGIVARLAGLYGPGRSIHLKKMREGSALIEGAGDRWINQIHRDDAAEAIVHLASLDSPPPIVNVSDDTPLMQRDLYALIAAHLHLPTPPHGPPGPRKRGSSNKRVSNALLRSTGWIPRHPSYAEFLKELVPFAR